MDEAEMRARFAQARVAALVTVRPEGRPHVVPVCFALVADEIVSAVDAKPKSTRALARLENVRAHPEVALLVDHYDDDWSQLWWVRVDGAARVEDLTDARLGALREKYPQYESMSPEGPAIVTRAERWTGWEWR